MKSGKTKIMYLTLKVEVETLDTDTKVSRRQVVKELNDFFGKKASITSIGGGSKQISCRGLS